MSLQSHGGRVSLIAAASAALALLIGCHDATGPDSPDAPPRFGVSANQVQDPVTVGILAKGLAVALADEGFRWQILEDLRDSPFPQHSIHLRSYLSGSRGESIMGVLNGELGTETGSFVRALAASGNVALRLNSIQARTSWTGGADLLVAPSWSGAVVGGVLQAYRPGGKQIAIGVYDRVAAPFVVHVSDIDFGPDPESRRASAPKHDRGTVSTIDEELGGGRGVYIIEPDPCDIDPNLPECDNGDPNYPIPGTSAACFLPSSGDDADQDGFSDSCEYAVAAAFAPELHFQYGDQDFTRESHWAVRPLFGNVVRIFYALAYHRDTGRWFGHNGDSEFVVVEGKHIANGNWEFYQVFTAAHYQVGFPSYAESSEWTTVPSFSLSRPLAPRVWVAQDKHASYNSLSACNAGSNGLDHCDTPDIVQDFSVYSNKNLGRQGHYLVNCTPSSQGFPAPECFWSDTEFRGWISDSGSSADDYRGHLLSFGM